MISVNMLEKEDEVVYEHYATLLRLLAPFAPHLAEELWHETGNKTSIHTEPWPTHDESLLRGERRIVIQVNGKLRGALEGPQDLDEAAVLARARALPGLEKHLVGKTIRRTVYVPGRLFNIVLV